MLTFILGKSGSGKTYEAVETLTKLRRQGNKKLLMLVPDQSSFETEKTFLHRLGPSDCRDVLVFGFNRLCEYVFDKTGNIPQNVIDDGVRKILMNKAIDEVGDKLGIFSGKAKRNSVLSLMVHSLKECKKDGITAQMLLDVSDRVDSEILKNKLYETSLVLEAYDALLQNTYVDPLENLNRLRDILSAENLFEGYTIVVDSFSGFTYQQLEIIEILMKRADSFYVTLNLDIEQKGFDIFETTSRTYRQLKRIADLNGIERGKNVILAENRRASRNDISFLEKYVLRINNEVFPEKADNISTFTASNIYTEINFVARKIKSLICDEGYSYGDIAVITRDLTKYDGVLDTVFDKFEIPYFMDSPRDIFTTPVVRFISSAIDAVNLGFDRESALSMLKTGLTDLSDTEIAALENYLYIWNLDRSSLKKPFTHNPSGFEKLTEDDEKELDRLEAIRKRVIDPLVEFADSVKDKNGLEISEALYRLIQAYSIEEAIDKTYDELESGGLIYEADELARAYNSVTEALDKLISVVGNEKLTLKKYKEYLDYLLAEIKLSDIPRYQDQVDVASADRARLQNEKVVFIIGAIDGEFPSVPKTAGAFSENERKILIENNIPLTDSLEQLASHEKYLAYCALTSASEKVFVSCYLSDYSGGAYEPSEIFGEVQRLFPKCDHSSSAVINEADELYNKRQAFEYLAAHYFTESPELSTLRNYFENDTYYKPLLEKLDKAVDKRPFAITDSALSEKLFKKHMKISASQLETYNLCAFRYFCNYGLRARERRKAEIDPLQFGNIVHYFLEKFLKMNDKQALNNLSDGDIRTSIDSILLDYANENFGGLEDKSASFLALYERLKDNIFALIRQIIRQLGYSDFIPCDFELHIGGEIPAYKLDLNDGGSVSVTGYIDRVDILRKEDEALIRIVDYKTGNKEFKLYEILYGINLQMLLYLRAVQRGGEDYYKSKIIPTGVLYMPSTASDIDGDENNTEEKINKKLDSSFRMNGLVLGDEEVLNHMDRAGKFIKFGKSLEDGKYSESVASGEQFAMIFEHIDRVISEMAESLGSGRVEAKPVKGAVDGCKYCPYDSVCLRTYEDDYSFRRKVDAKEVYTTLEKEGEGI